MVRVLTEQIGRRFIAGVEEVGYGSAMLAESLYWVMFGRWRQQPVHLRLVAEQMMQVGVAAIPIVAVLAFSNGIMMALQGIYTLEQIGAEAEVIPGLALSVTREFGALVAGIIVAGRSGSAVAARIGAMQMSQEIDALSVLGVNPVRYLVAPVFIAMLLMLPALTILADVMALLGGGLLCALKLDISLGVYAELTLASLTSIDVFQGIVKSAVFAALIAIVSSINGFSVEGGADGLGRTTTRSVVLCIAAIIVADMVFTFFLSR